MTLRALLLARIAQAGPMTLADYMADCLLHPVHGYYATRDPLGAAGDFTTAPEISQMFGELLGLWAAQVWHDQGRPDPFILAELGPGRGTLMADALRATRGLAGFHAAMSLHLVEASPPLRAAQGRALAPFAPTWIERVENLPPGPLILLANEFLDALPIRQFQRAPEGWREVMVAAPEGRLAFALTAPAPLAALAHRLGDTRPGDVVETRAPAESVAREVAARLSVHGGAALFVDYGTWGSLGDTFQAMAAHAFTDPLADPGGADLTAHVDFRAIARAAPEVRAHFSPQGAFLARLGLHQRARALAARMDGPAQDRHRAATERLTSPQGMGTLFRALALTPHAAPPPPGLDAAPPHSDRNAPQNAPQNAPETAP